MDCRGKSSAAATVVIALLNVFAASTSDAVLIKEGVEKVLDAGQQLTLTCEGQGPLRWTFPDHVKERVRLIEQPHKVLLTLDDSRSSDTGYYNCSEQRNPSSTASTYVYVYDGKNLFVYNNMTVITAVVGQSAHFPCRATHPAVEVVLNHNGEVMHDAGHYDPRTGFSVQKVSIDMHGSVVCEATLGKNVKLTFYYFVVKVPVPMPKPFINATNRIHVIEGEDVRLECSVALDGEAQSGLYTLRWIGPKNQQINNGSRSIVSMRNSRRRVRNQRERLSLHLNSIRKSDEGNYSCVISQDFQENKEVVLILVRGKNMSFIDLKVDSKVIEASEKRPIAKWAVDYQAAPIPTFQWLDPNGRKISSNAKYNITVNSMQTVLTISSLTPSDAGVYTVIGRAGSMEKQLNLTLLIKAQPLVTMQSGQAFYMNGKTYQVKCKIKSHPIANVTWSFTNCTDYSSCAKNDAVIQKEDMTPNKDTYELEMKALSSGVLHCEACNVLGCRKESLKLFIADHEDGFHLNGHSSAAEGDNVTLTCIASKYNYTNGITWWFKGTNGKEFQQIHHQKDMHPEEIISYLSIESILYMYNVSHREHNGQYLCKAMRRESLGEHGSPVTSNLITLSINERKFPTFEQPQKDPYYIFPNGEAVWLDCRVHIVTGCELQWFKEGKSLNLLGINSRYEFRNAKQTLFIEHSDYSDKGVYECVVQNFAGSIRRTFNVTILKPGQSSPQNSSGTTVGVTVGVIAILLIALAYLVWRMKRERRRAHTLTIQDVTAFHEGALLTVDPDLGIDEQAELLPYNKDFEFPREKLKFGKQLGTGAFGRVVKAEAEGLKEEEKFTTVAVKMVKPHSDISHLKALMTELKILIYIGHHLNVLNLLGACTTNLIHKELFVILEYCRYGNLHSYLQRHRESFINQVNPMTDVVDFNIGKDATLRPYKDEVSLNPSGETSKDSRVMFDNSSGQLLYSDTTGENSMSTMADSSGSSNPADLRWNITYKADFKGKLAAPLNTKDLLCWSYQVAMGMEYLAGLKIVHADLAARNILLADENIVKICDFGLARNLYKNMDYKKKGQDPLPIKWMAIESIEDRIFSTKSDVWSFGVVLWELFSLAKTPYPGMEVNEEFLQQLIKGTRMAKPEYSTQEMQVAFKSSASQLKCSRDMSKFDRYRIMLGCWKTKPSDRPSFKDLVHRIGDALDGDIKQHYLELNTPYVNQNIKAMSRNTYVNYCDTDNSEYIKPGFPERLYVNMKQFDNATQDKTNRISEEESDNPAFADEPEYLPMTK